MFLFSVCIVLDNAPEEKAREIDITGHTDCLGHADYISRIRSLERYRWTVRFYSLLPRMVLCPRPNNIYKQSGINHIVVFINKVDQLSIRKWWILSKWKSNNGQRFGQSLYAASRGEEGGRQKPFASYFQLQMFSKTWDCAAHVLSPDKEMIRPGEDAKLHLKLMKPMVLEQGKRFLLRDGRVILGTGVITNVLQPLTGDDQQ